MKRLAPLFTFAFLGLTCLGIGVIGVVSHSALAATTIVDPDSQERNFFNPPNETKTVYSVNADVAKIIANKDRMLDCAGDIFSLFQRDIAQEVENFAKSAAQQAIRQFAKAITQDATCYLQSLLDGRCLIVFGEGGCIGDFSNIRCTASVVEESTGVLLDQWKARAKQQFLGACTTAYASYFVQDTAHTMVTSQGAGGGPAYVTDWKSQISSKPDEIAQRQFWALLVNTDMCDYFRDDMLDLFSVPQAYRNNHPPIDAMMLRTSAGDPFTVRGQCTLPPGYVPGSDAVSPADFTASLISLVEPQNNPSGFYQMAVDELSAQRTLMAQAAYAEAISGGGFLSVYGPKETSCLPDPANQSECITYGTVRQPPQGVANSVNLSNTMEMMRVINAVEGDLLEDVSARLQTSMLDLANKPLNLELRSSAHYTSTRDTPEPEPTRTPGSDDAACTGGDARCSCIATDPNYLGVARGLAPTLVQVLRNWNNPDIGITDGNGKRIPELPFDIINTYLPDSYFNANLIPGGDWGRLFLVNFCARMSGGSCKPHPTRDTDFVITVGNGMSMSFQALLPSTAPDGKPAFLVLTENPTPRALCEPGVQD